MSNYIKTPSKLKNPGWTKRNIKISKHILPGTAVLDLGCGAKDLLRYIQPSTYYGIDYLDDHADMKMDFNHPFSLPKYKWNYIVSSGVIEYLTDVNMFFNTIKNNSEYYIITIWKNYDTLNNPNKLKHVDDYVNLINTHFDVVNEDYWKLNKIFICKDKT